MLRKFLCFLTALALALCPAEAGTRLLLGAGAGATTAPGAPTSVINRIQQTSITIAGGSTSNTATITSVVTANTILIWNGTTTTNGANNNYNREGVLITLTNATTVTASRGDGTTSAVTVKFTVVEFASGVNSVQAGTISVTSATSGTATISAVGANAFVLYQGMTTTQASLLIGDVQTGVDLTNSTTVTAHCLNTATAKIIGYMVVDLDSTIVSAIQQRTLTSTANVATENDTITSRTVGNTLLFWGGDTSAAGIAAAQAAWTDVLAGATTVTFTKTTAATTTRTQYYTAVEFAAGALNGSVQRGTITISAGTSNTATITGVDTAKSFLNWGGFLSANGIASVVDTALALTNGTTVTANVNSSGTTTSSYEVIQFN